MNKNQILISELTTRLEELHHFISQLKPNSDSLFATPAPVNLEQRNLAFGGYFPPSTSIPRFDDSSL
jgi:hypothetical protein